MSCLIIERRSVAVSLATAFLTLALGRYETRTRHVMLEVVHPGETALRTSLAPWPASPPLKPSDANPHLTPTTVSDASPITAEAT
jgi:hypothetical protein